MAAPVLRPLSLGEVLDVAFSLYRQHFVTLLLIALATHAIPMVLSIYTAMSNDGGSLIMSLVTLGLTTVLGAIGVAVTTFVVSDSYMGRQITTSDAFHRAIPYIGNLILIAVLTTLAVGLGFLLLVVPGVILLCGLGLSTQALVLENVSTATGAMSRSWQLTRGYRGKIFGALFVAGLLVAIPQMALGSLAVVSQSMPLALILAFVLPALLQILIYPFFNAIFTVLYYDLRVRKESFDLEMLAAALERV